MAWLLVLGMTSNAHAQEIYYTTIPHSSGAVTCNGKNTDDTTATWTVGGNICLTTGDADSPYSEWYYKYVPAANPTVDPNALLFGACVANISLSTNVKAGITLSGQLKLVYQKPNVIDLVINSIGTYQITRSNDVTSVETVQISVDFETIPAGLNLQYKITSGQASQNTQDDWQVATPYIF